VNRFCNYPKIKKSEGHIGPILAHEEILVFFYLVQLSKENIGGILDFLLLYCMSRFFLLVIFVIQLCATLSRTVEKLMFVIQLDLIIRRGK
jgi:hypothetical protein